MLMADEVKLILNLTSFKLHVFKCDERLLRAAESAIDCSVLGLSNPRTFRNVVGVNRRGLLIW